MVNEDIVTILRNAVAKGEPLQHAIQILTNSGYDPQQVQEASTYVQGGTMQGLSTKPDEQLIMAQNKRIFPGAQNNQQNQMRQSNPQQTSPNQQTPMQKPPQMQQPPQNQIQQQMNSQMSTQKMPLQNGEDAYGANSMAPNQIKQLSQPVGNQIQMQQPLQKNPIQQNSQIQQQISQQTQNSQNQMQQQAQKNPAIKLKKKSHKKEIILLLILLFLIGVLATTVIFRGSILSFLSG